MKKIPPALTNLVFYSGMLMGVYTLIRIFLSRQGLAPGACPVESHPEKIIVTVILLAAYFIMTFFTKETPDK